MHETQRKEFNKLKEEAQRDFLKGLPFQRPVLSTKTVHLVDFVYALKVFNDIGQCQLLDQYFGLFLELLLLFCDL